MEDLPGIYLQVEDLPGIHLQVAWSYVEDLPGIYLQVVWSYVTYLALVYKWYYVEDLPGIHPQVVWSYVKDLPGICLQVVWSYVHQLEPSCNLVEAVSIMLTEVFLVNLDLKKSFSCSYIYIDWCLLYSLKMVQKDVVDFIERVALNWECQTLITQ